MPIRLHAPKRLSSVSVLHGSFLFLRFPHSPVPPSLWEEWCGSGVRTSIEEKLVNPHWVVIAASVSQVGGLRMVVLGGRVNVPF